MPTTSAAWGYGGCSEKAKVNDPWAPMWNTFKSRIDELHSQLRAVNPEITFNGGRWPSNEASPFCAYASFGFSYKKLDEGLVVSLDCFRVGDRIRRSVDIARGEGEVLAELPDAEAMEAEVPIEQWAKEVGEFIVANAELVAQVLSVP
jgi:hypothetical protein